MAKAKTLVRMVSWIVLALGIATAPRGVRSLSPGSTDPLPLGSTGTASEPTAVSPEPIPTRRRLLRAAAMAAAAGLSGTRSADAACLTGDTRPVCIGIYKVPQDAAFSNYISTPEQLKEFAPDLTYVPPTPAPSSYKQALEILEGQRVVAEGIRRNVAAGRLEDAGVGVLGLIPQVTASGRFVVDELSARVYRKQQAAKKLAAAPPPPADGEEPEAVREYDENGYKLPTTADELAVDMASNQMDYVAGYFGECDICIGQGIRGELGVSAVAQLTILASLKDATIALDDFVATAASLGARM
ncbi:unnamed protein product [Pseudo-nitzschia multistriata]|uniref:Uncharacterized protein n=1 Tax=Pseudo-nitzschia multistriata TaxID=183589 RepID=A0A448Z6F5_9STRA|nr:unnamed protein product [Pseudo-nitzschia multistriata]